MKIDKQNSIKWGGHIATKQLAYPDERAARFLGRHFNKSDNSELKALDAGFGTGRHLSLLNDYGFQVHGIDFANEAFDVTKKLNTDLYSKFNLKNSQLSDFPFGKEYFDVILAIGILFLKEENEIRKDIKALYDSLKTGGKAFVNFRTINNYFYGMGEKVSKNTFLLDERAEEYNEMYYTFLDENEAKNFVEEAGFSIINIEYIELRRENLTKTHSWWTLELEKK